jgi:hypothetical protein
VANRSYHFQSFWDIDAPVKTVWQTLTATPFSWDDWWPELQDLKIVKANPGLVGTVFTCRWRAPVGYKLKTRIIICEVIPGKFVTLKATGDLTGWVKCMVKAVGNRTHVDIQWGVETSKPWMNLLYPVLKPLFTQSHHAVMKSGELGLQEYISKNSPA